MVYSLWVYLLSCPEQPVPFPWERCYDLGTDVLFYKNAVYGTIVIDLRPRINLGGGLFHDNSMWYDLTGRSSHYQALFRDYQHDQDSPFLLYTNCCGSLVYLVVPELVQHCPLCGCFVSFFG
ncbi:protein CURLY FLAG LEAF 2-like [Fagus crenata]|uniref:Uncharacterized protein n=1 Tax=Fagus sylvatica TaxID=28930 RepID=A0A2N9HP89_FAGSY